MYCYQVMASNAGGNSAPSSTACAGEFALTPVADATVFNYTPNSNDGTSGLLYVQSDSVNNQYGATLIRFDLSAVPQNATIQNAYLGLTPYSVSGTPTLRISRLASTPSWSETGVTWNNMPYADGSFAAAYFPVSGSSTNLDGVTSFVQAWVSGSYPNNGFQLFTLTNVTSAGFYSRESTGIGGTPPSLTFTFYSP